MADVLWQLKNRSYCAGVVLQDGKVIQAAPILKWALGKGEKWLRHHCKKHQIQITEVTAHEHEG